MERCNKIWEILRIAMIRKVTYKRADDKDYNLMLKLEKLGDLSPKAKLIALEIMESKYG